MGQSDEAVIESEMKNVRQFLGALEQNLADNERVARKLSIADFAIASTFMFRGQAGISLAETPAVANWIANLECRVSWQAALAPLVAVMQD